MKKGFTLVELAVSISILTLLVGVVLVIINPLELYARGRDARRLADLAMLMQALEEYKIDTNTLPDLSDTTRRSDTLPSGNSGPLQKASDGWIDEDLSKYLTKLLTDPKNESPLIYRYKHDGVRYKLDCKLEYYKDLMKEDGGMDDSRFELGTGIDTISF